MKTKLRLPLRKGQFIEIDVLVAIVVLIAGIILLKTTFIHSYDTPQTERYAQDIVKILQTQQMKNIDLAAVEVEYQNDPGAEPTFEAAVLAAGVSIDPEETVARQSTILLVKRKDKAAQALVNTVIGNLLPANGYDYSIAINDKGTRTYLVPQSPTATPRYLSQSRVLLTGLEVDRPVYGFTGTLFLSDVANRKASYAYFGGFTGQGKIELHMDLPADFNVSHMLKNITVEGDFQDNFSVRFNNMSCAEHIKIPDNAGYRGNITRVNLDIITPSCPYYLWPGTNRVIIEFNSTNISNHYVAGGFVRVSYNTKEIELPAVTAVKWLPSIDGIFNIYDSVYIPGELEEIDVRLHYEHDRTNNSDTVLFVLGNYTIWEDNLSANVNEHIDHAAIEAMGINYTDFNNQTIPIRLGYKNFTGLSFQGAVDAMITTDMSGSMWFDPSWGSGTLVNDCSSPQIYLPTTKRISVARCADKLFVESIFANTTQSRVGLVSYDYFTRDSHYFDPSKDEFEPLTNNKTQLISTIDGYVIEGTGGATCICCGILASIDEHVRGNVDEFFTTGTDWYFENNSKDGSIAPQGGNLWYEEGYDHSAWEKGPSVIGNDLGGLIVPTISTDIGGSINFKAIDLWELGADRDTPYMDYSSMPYNSTGDDISDSSDGWDRIQRAFDPSSYPRGADNFLFTNNTLTIVVNSGSDEEASAAMGVNFEITPQDLALLNSGEARLYLATESRVRITSEDSTMHFWDRGWIKAKINKSGSPDIFLGDNIDGETNNVDMGGELWYARGLTNLRALGFTSTRVDITNYVISEGDGEYYLTLGGKIQRNYANLSANFEFRKTMLYMLKDQSNHYYLRKNFTITNVNDHDYYYIHYLADNYANIYINGELIHSGTESIPELRMGAPYGFSPFLEPGNVQSIWGDRARQYWSSTYGQYWKRVYLPIDKSKLNNGENVFAVELINTHFEAKFDMEFVGGNYSEAQPAILVMTDGDPNVLCPLGENYELRASNHPQADDDAITAACVAKELLNSSIYAVVFSTADIPTMQSVANCDDPDHYKRGENFADLETIYKNISSGILQTAAYNAQSVSVEGTGVASKVFNDSVVRFKYKPAPREDIKGRILISYEQDFNEINPCVGDLKVPSIGVPYDVRVVSYSGSHWTDKLVVNHVNSYFNLSTYGEDYHLLGDPYVLGVPDGVVTTGNNHFELSVGDDPTTPFECGTNNKIIYNLAINSTISSPGIYERAEGCLWTVQAPTGPPYEIAIPSDYPGPNHCVYRPLPWGTPGREHHSDPTSNILYYNETDALQVLAFLLFENLNNPADSQPHNLDLYISSENININFLEQEKIPYLWGPAVMEVAVWQ